MLQSALDLYARQQKLTAAALLTARRRGVRDFRGIAEVTSVFQVLAARETIAAFPAMLEEQSIEDAPVARVLPDRVAGTASDGRPLESLFAQATSPEALGLMVVTQVQDAARAAGSLGIGVRPHAGYVRMISAGACARCAILAGKFYRFNDGFLRHPHCACQHIPTRENLADDLTTNTDEYFRSLTPFEQERIFTKGGAEAIRQGADVSQVVNARRVTSGMQFAQGSQTTTKIIRGEEFTVNVRLATGRRNALGEADRSGLFTTEGSTARGIGGQQQKGLRRNGAQQARPMPETILMRAKDQADAVRLFRLYGYIDDPIARAAGRAAFRAEAAARRAVRRAERKATTAKAAVGPEAASGGAGSGARGPDTPIAGGNAPREFPDGIPFSRADLPSHSADEYRHAIDGHLSGSGVPGKTEFPWSDENEVVAAIADVVDSNDPLTFGHKLIFIGTHRGYEIRVEFETYGNRVAFRTAYPPPQKGPRGGRPIRRNLA